VWLAFLAVPLIVRGPLPPDELRYLSVAWEMWNRGDLVVPWLNGAPYADKGPLLFWLTHLGWTVFGVNGWWPRLLPAVFALTVVLLARALAMTLWPANRAAAALVPWLTIGSLAVTLYAQVVLVDLLLTSCTLLALLGLARAERGQSNGWLLLTVATALGLLTKGPVMLLHLSGAALLAPWWRRETSGVATRSWYAWLAAALACGIAVSLLWAIVAVGHGGAAYEADIFVNQTADRFAGGFGHARPFWFYLAMLPTMLFPWSAWPTAWRAVLAALRGSLADRGWRLLAATIAPTFIAFSLIRSKQPHYILPLVPLFACLLASALAAWRSQRDSARLPLVLAASATTALAVLPLIAPARLAVEPWPPLPGLVAAFALVLLSRPGTTTVLARRIALLAPLLVVPAEAAFFMANRTGYDTSGAAAFVRSLQDAGHPIAYTRDYEGEFHFTARLTQPLEVVGRDESAAAAWSQRHPDGYLVRYGESPRADAVYSQRLRGDWLSIVPARL
jgi:4-amino-4-deoxy-L-arabinose transferase-like glycosyltransferase